MFSLLLDCMWEAPVAQAKHTVHLKEREQEVKLQVNNTNEDKINSKLSCRIDCTVY